MRVNILNYSSMAGQQQNPDPEFQKDYEFVKKDVRKVAINNVIFIALLVGLYFANQRFGWLSHLEKLF